MNDFAGLRFDYPRRLETVELPGCALQLAVFTDLEQVIDDVIAAAQASGHLDWIEETPPYFGQVWPSARGLAHQLVQKIASGELQLDQHARVLELGCGLALPSFVLARLTSAQLLATDSHPDVPIFLAHNARINGVQDRLAYQHRDWSSYRASVANALTECYDLLIASDVLYESTFAATLAQALTQLAHRESRVMLADPGRPALQEFSHRMRDLGWSEKMESHRVGDGKQEDIWLLEYRKINAE